MSTTVLVQLYFVVFGLYSTHLSCVVFRTGGCVRTRERSTRRVEHQHEHLGFPFCCSSAEGLKVGAPCGICPLNAPLSPHPSPVLPLLLFDRKKTQMKFFNYEPITVN